MFLVLGSGFWFWFWLGGGVLSERKGIRWDAGFCLPSIYKNEGGRTLAWLCVQCLVSTSSPFSIYKPHPIPIHPVIVLVTSHIHTYISCFDLVPSSSPCQKTTTSKQRASKHLHLHLHTHARTHAHTHTQNGPAKHLPRRPQRRRPRKRRRRGQPHPHLLQGRRARGPGVDLARRARRQGAHD
ncbi:hypothetical protein J3F83DRAFT_282654 [Trichoderma novae-zelandiae]